MDNPSDSELKELLEGSRSIAMVGLSNKPERDSFQVAAYLQEQGYRIYPVNPSVDEILGVKSYDSLDAIPDAIDIVDVFRRQEAVPEVVAAAMKLAPKAIWLQRELRAPEGMAVRYGDTLIIQDRCIKVEHRRLI